MVPDGDSRFFTLRPVHIDLGDMVVQVVAVALGVLLGLGAAAWTDRLREQATLHDTVGNIATEVRSNQQGLHVVMAAHAKLATDLNALVKSATPRASVSRGQIVTLFRGRPFSQNIPLGIAWQIAQNDRGLALLPYDERYQLAWVYQLQTVFVASEQRFADTVFSPQAPAADNYFFATVSLANQVGSIVANERQLDGLYTSTLRSLHEQYGV